MINKKAKIILFSIMCGFGVHGGDQGTATPRDPKNIFKLAPKELYRWAYVDSASKEAISDAITKLGKVKRDNKRIIYPVQGRFIVFEIGEEIHIARVTNRNGPKSEWTFQKLGNGKFEDATQEESKKSVKAIEDTKKAAEAEAARKVAEAEETRGLPRVLLSGAYTKAAEAAEAAKKAAAEEAVITLKKATLAHIIAIFRELISLPEIKLTNNIDDLLNLEEGLHNILNDNKDKIKAMIRSGDVFDKISRLQGINNERFQNSLCFYVVLIKNLDTLFEKSNEPGFWDLIASCVEQLNLIIKECDELSPSFDRGPIKEITGSFGQATQSGYDARNAALVGLSKFYHSSSDVVKSAPYIIGGAQDFLHQGYSGIPNAADIIAALQKKLSKAPQAISAALQKKSSEAPQASSDFSSGKAKLRDVLGLETEIDNIFLLSLTQNHFGDLNRDETRALYYQLKKISAVIERKFDRGNLTVDETKQVTNELSEALRMLKHDYAVKDPTKARAVEKKLSALLRSIHDTKSESMQPSESIEKVVGAISATDNGLQKKLSEASASAISEFYAGSIDTKKADELAEQIIKISGGIWFMKLDAAKNNALQTQLTQILQNLSTQCLSGALSAVRADEVEKKLSEVSDVLGHLYTLSRGGQAADEVEKKLSEVSDVLGQPQNRLLQASNFFKQSYIRALSFTLKVGDASLVGFDRALDIARVSPALMAQAYNNATRERALELVAQVGESAKTGFDMAKGLGLQATQKAIEAYAKITDKSPSKEAILSKLSELKTEFSGMAQKGIERFTQFLAPLIKELNSKEGKITDPNHRPLWTRENVQRVLQNSEFNAAMEEYMTSAYFAVPELYPALPYYSLLSKRRPLVSPALQPQATDAYKEIREDVLVKMNAVLAFNKLLSPQTLFPQLNFYQQRKQLLTNPDIKKAKELLDEVKEYASDYDSDYKLPNEKIEEAIHILQQFPENYTPDAYEKAKELFEYGKKIDELDRFGAIFYELQADSERPGGIAKTTVVGFSPEIQRFDISDNALEDEIFDFQKLDIGLAELKKSADSLKNRIKDSLKTVFSSVQSAIKHEETINECLKQSLADNDKEEISELRFVHEWAKNEANKVTSDLAGLEKAANILDANKRIAHRLNELHQSYNTKPAQTLITPFKPIDSSKMPKAFKDKEILVQLRERLKYWKCKKDHADLDSKLKTMKEQYQDATEKINDKMTAIKKLLDKDAPSKEIRSELDALEITYGINGTYEAFNDGIKRIREFNSGLVEHVQSIDLSLLAQPGAVLFTVDNISNIGIGSSLGISNKFKFDTDSVQGIALEINTSTKEVLLVGKDAAEADQGELAKARNFRGYAKDPDVNRILAKIQAANEISITATNPYALSSSKKYKDLIEEAIAQITGIELTKKDGSNPKAILVSRFLERNAEIIDKVNNVYVALKQANELLTQIAQFISGIGAYGDAIVEILPTDMQEITNHIKSKATKSSDAIYTSDKAVIYINSNKNRVFLIDTKKYKDKTKLDIKKVQQNTELKDRILDAIKIGVVQNYMKENEGYKNFEEIIQEVQSNEVLLDLFLGANKGIVDQILRAHELAKKANSLIPGIQNYFKQGKLDLTKSASKGKIVFKAENEKEQWVEELRSLLIKQQNHSLFKGRTDVFETQLQDVKATINTTGIDTQDVTLTIEYKDTPDLEGFKAKAKAILSGTEQLITGRPLKIQDGFKFLTLDQDCARANDYMDWEMEFNVSNDQHAKLIPTLTKQKATLVPGIDGRGFYVIEKSDGFQGKKRYITVACIQNQDTSWNIYINTSDNPKEDEAKEIIQSWKAKLRDESKQKLITDLISANASAIAIGRFLISSGTLLTLDHLLGRKTITAPSA